MRVKDVMIPTVEVAHPDDLLRAAAEKMKSCAVDPLPVCQDDRLIGMVTEDRVQAEAQARGLSAGMAPVREAMIEGIAYCFGDQDETEAVEILKAHQDLPGLCVVNRDRRLIGVLPASVLEGRARAQRGKKPPEGAEPYDAITRDPVDHMSEESFPASDPPASPTSLSPQDSD